MFMKTLYYPKITDDDYKSLLVAFENEYRKDATKGRMAYIYSLASLGITWGLAYRYRFSTALFLGSLTAGFFATYSTIRFFNSKAMKKNLNHYAESIATKYPEVKFSLIEYVNSNDLHAKI